MVAFVFAALGEPEGVGLAIAAAGRRSALTATADVMAIFISILNLGDGISRQNKRVKPTGHIARQRSLVLSGKSLRIS